MRLKTFLFAGTLMLMVGCTSQKVESPAPAVTPQAKVMTQEKAAPVAATPVSVTCDRAADKRTIGLESPNGSEGCSVQYMKFGKTARAAWSDHDKNYCTVTAAKIRKNLEAAGFKCGP